MNENIKTIIENYVSEIINNIFLEGRAHTISIEEMENAVNRLPEDLKSKFPGFGFVIKKGRKYIEPFDLVKSLVNKPEIYNIGQDSLVFSLSLGNYYEQDKMPTKNEINIVANYIENIFLKRRGWHIVSIDILYGRLEIKISKEKTQKLNKIPKFVYHLTDTANVENIKKIGLIPKKSKRKSMRYSNRVYVFADTKLLWDMIRYNYKAHEDNSNFSNKLTKTTDVTAIMIDTNKLRKGTKFYKDPDFGIKDEAYYTFTHIPPDAIVGDQRVDWGKGA